MVTVKARDVLTGLGKKGFSLSQGDHSHLIFCVGGKKTAIRTKVSQGRSEIDDHLVNLMSMQVKLEKKKFIELINCPLTLNDYLRELEQQGITFT
jgi:predicted RNA binding protein YcfA (HicA-like mRNA interferase family)